MRVLITGAFRYPDGDAAAYRVASVAKLFVRMGATVVVAGWEEPVRGEQYSHDGVLCFSQGEFRQGESAPLHRLLQFAVRGQRTMQWLSSQPRFDVVVAYNPPALFAARVMQYCRRHSSVAVLDSTEWYQSSHLPLGQFGPAAFENWLRMRAVYPRFRHVIAISTWLAAYFHGRNVLRLPPLIDSAEPRSPAHFGGAAQDLEARPDISQGIELVYAGQPGRKDSLACVIRALPLLSRALHRPVRLTIAGLDTSAFHAYCRVEGIDIAMVDAHVRCVGRIRRTEVAQLYRSSHFSVLFRADERFAWAGFPTKATESWQHGCPIICNAVGELASIGRDGADVLFVNPKDVAGSLLPRLQAIDDTMRYASMSAASTHKAQQLFSADRFHAEFDRFISAMRHGEPRRQSAAWSAA